MSKHFNIHASKDGVTKIEIFGQIGESFFEEGNTLESVKKEIDGREDTLEVDIASLGGNAFEGLAIHDLFAMHKGKVIMNMVGATASAGMVIAESGDEINISENTLALIHNSHGFAIGGAEDLKKTADDMEKIDARMLSIFSKRAEGKKTEKEIKALMHEDKFIDADEAIKFGLADKKIETSKIAAKVNLKTVLESKELSDAQKEQLKSQYGETAPVEPAKGFDFSTLNKALESLTSVIKGFKKSDSGKDVTILDETAVTSKLEEVANEITAAKDENKTLTDKNAEHVTSIEALTKSEKKLKDEIAKLNGSQEELGGNDGDPTGDKDAEGEGAFGNFIKSGVMKRLKSA